MPVTRNIKTADNKTQTKNKIKNALAFYKSSGFNANSWGDVRTDYNALNPDNTIANREAASSFLTKLNTANNIIDNPPVNANFVHNSFTKDSSTSTFDEMFTFSATTNRTMFDSTGTLVWAPHNTLTHSEDFTNAAWSNTDTTDSANTQEAPDGETTADTVTASAGNGTITQSWTAVAADYTFAVWLKRKTGTGNIQIAADDGTWTTVTITSSWALYTVEQTTTAGSKNAGIRIVTSGDEVYAWGAHLYRSDLGGMADNPDQGSGFETYIPTTTAAVYAARRNAHYYSGGWTNGGLLLEHAAATNILPYSEDFAQWYNDDSTYSSNTLTAAATSNARMYVSPLSVPSSGTYTFWADLEAGSSNWAALRPILFDDNAIVYFDLSTGTVGTETLGTGTIFEVEPGVYRCCATFSTTTDLNGGFFVNVVDGDNSLAVTNGATIKIYRAQLEAGSVPSSYIPTNGSTVTRAAENLTMPSAVTPIKKESGTMMFDALVSYTSNSPGIEVFDIGGNNDIFLRSATSSYSRWSSGSASAVTESGGLIPHGINQHARVSFAYSENVREMLSVNGTTGHYINTTTLSDLSSTDISAFYTGSTVSAFFREMSLWDVDLGNTSNLVPKSEDFTDWTAENSLTLDHAATTIDGISFTRWNTGATSRQSARRDYYTTSSDKTISFYAKADGGQFFQVLPYDGGTNRCHAVFDLTNGTITETFAIGTHTIVSTGITDVGNDVYRCRLTYNTTDNNQNIYMIVSPTGTPDGFGAATSPGENNDILIGGFQIEAGTDLTDYVKKPSFNGGLEYLSGDPYEVEGYYPELVADFVGNTIEKPYYRYDGAETDFSSLFTFGATTNRTMFNEYGNLVWAPHNLAVNSDTPATQTITVLSGVKYTVGMTGSGSFVLSGGGSGTATENNPVQITTSSTSLTITLNGSATRVWVYRSDLGGMADNPDQPLGLEKYVPTGASVVYAARRGAYRYDSTAGEWVNGGLQLESAAATNAIADSNSFSGWGVVRSSFSSAAATGPDGVSGSAWKFVEDGSNDGHYAQSYSAATPTDKYWVWSCYIKDAGDSRYICLRFRTLGGTSPFLRDVVFDPTDGSAYNPTGLLETGYEDIGNGWFRVWATADVGDATSFLMPLIGLSNVAEPAVNPAAPTYQGDGSSGVYIYGMQFEEGKIPTSYIPTNGSTVTRAAETLSVAGADTPANTTAQTYSLKGLVTYADLDSASQLGLLKQQVDGNNYIIWYLATFGGSGTPYVNQRTAGVTDFVIGSGSEISDGINSEFSIAARHGATFVNAAVNGTALTANTTPTALADLSGASLQVGYVFNGFISELRMWGTDIGDSGIEEVTS